MRDEIDTISTTVLVVDDSPTDRTLVARLLTVERPDWNVVETSTVAEGLKVLARQSVTVVVTDVFMPEMSGEEFMAKVHRRFPSVPVILTTSLGNDEIAARSFELGAVNYIPKRRLADDLVAAVDDVLRALREAALARDVFSNIVRSQTVFRIDSNLDQIRALLHLICERLQTLRFLQEDEVREVTDAVREALMNAHIHGGHSSSGNYETGSSFGGAETGVRADSIIEVEFSISEERICFMIKDQGSGFDTSTVGEIDESKLRNGFRTMRRNMDRIEFNSSGNRIGLTKELTPSRAV
ncbi:MAG: response regulator [Fuerstiella sp.]|nr:response regulator [Fuerstiella sp.]